MKGGQVLAPQALSMGVNTLDFMVGLGIMLYLLFFLLRDGRALAEQVEKAITLHSDQKAALFARFADVVRATVKGGIVVAIVQDEAEQVACGIQPDSDSRAAA
jgi:predicted PurR-regulated permease PerM